MTVHLVTFASSDYLRSATLCVESAKRNGVNEATIVTPSEPSTERGFGFWRWKPQTILNRMTLGDGQFLKPLVDDDVLIYSDAGVEFITPISHIIERMDQDIFLFGNNWEHAHWCKRDVLDALMPQSTQCPACHKWCGGVANRTPCEAGYYYHPTIGKQVQASVIFFRVSDYTRAFVKEWLDWCLFEGGRLIDDSPSRLSNHPEFREHRHDQAILTTMAYREGIKLHYWSAVYNRGGSPEFVYEKLPEYASDSYPVLFSHHRKRDHEFEEAA